MKTSTLFSLIPLTFTLFAGAVLADADATNANVTEVILSNAAADNIDLQALSFLGEALNEIQALNNTTPTRRRSVSSPLGRFAPRQVGSIIDVHTHVVPSWYKALVPTTGGNPTPDWDIDSYLAFMASEGISHSVFSFSAPGANVYQGQKILTLALARLINEQSAAYARAHPDKLDFYAVVPLPYTAEAIIEATYALDFLGAAGIFLTSNFEGVYLGNAQIKPFFDAINRRKGKTIFYIHPGTPYVKVNNKLVEANPTPYPTGNIEFYFETARTIMDLTLTQTIHNFTNINYIIPHVGGAFPACLDRILKSAPQIYDSSLNIYNTRFWWDSAGPTFYHQISGLLGIGVPKSQLLFGTDYPYAPGFTQAGSLAAVVNSVLLSAAEKTALFTTNAKALFGSKINCELFPLAVCDYGS